MVFQPGEEIAAGAQAMVDDALWDKAPKPQVFYGQHVMPSLAGTGSYISGDAMAMADSWRVILRGEGSHGSQLQNLIDPSCWVRTSSPVSRASSLAKLTHVQQQS